jgi:ABC-type bacteriocin/lantibiotic exporter with double-glycine peptidase domain
MDKTIFKNVNIKINLGGIICINGSSGVGKSTLVDLILGLIKPQSGKILFNDKVINENISMYYKSFYYLPQSIYLLDDTILKNIIFNDGNSYDEELLNLALQVSEIKNFVNSLDKGIMTIIGENGSKISGGQRQRIGIARAIYNKASILIMDESTNALDLDTEIKIISNLKRIETIKTIFLITHRDKMHINPSTMLKLENYNIKKEYLSR